MTQGKARSRVGVAKASPSRPIYRPAMAALAGEISPDRWRYFGHVLGLNGHGGSPYLCTCQSSALSMVATVDGGGVAVWVRCCALTTYVRAAYKPDEHVSGLEFSQILVMSRNVLSDYKCCFFLPEENTGINL